MTQYGFHFDGTRCTGCKTCMLACKDRYDLSAEIAFRQIYEYGNGTWTKAENGAWTTDASTYYLSTACNHCDTPACVEVCPQSSMTKDEETGIVHNDPTTCIACGSCVEACPYNVPKIDPETNVSVKCDLCFDRIKAGEEPICVEACPLRALDAGEIDALRADFGDVAAIAPLPDPATTGPNIVITEPKNSQPFDDKKGEIQNTREIVS